MKRSWFVLITLLALLTAFSPAADAKLPSDNAVPRFSSARSLLTATPDPTATPQTAETPPTDEAAQVTPEEATTGEITGRVSNGTSGGEVPVDLLVTLYGVDMNLLALEVTSETGVGGEFSFKEVGLAEGRQYILAAEHQGVLYLTEPGIMPAGSETLDLPLTIYDATQDPSFVSVEQLHILFEFASPGVVSVLEVWVISNTGDATFSPGEAGYEIIIPDGASALRFQAEGMGERFLITERGFFDSAPIQPGVGSTQLLFTFDVPYDRRLDFVQPMSFDILAVDVLVPEGGPSIREGDLTDSGPRQVSSGILHTYSTGPIAAGETLEFRISGRVTGEAGDAGLTPLMGLVIGGVVLGVALLGFGFWWYRVGVRRSAAEPANVEDDVLHAIAELDDEHAAGKISDDAYRKRRDELKQRAIDMMQEEND